MNLRKITKKDLLELKKIYFNSILSINEEFYDMGQKIAWSSQAWDNPNFDKAIKNGKGWLIYEKDNLIAFLTRFPRNKIALFYCKGNYKRLGLGTKLLKKTEEDAKKEGLTFLITDASLISFNLFKKNNWEIIRKEKIIIKNKIFERYKMIKKFEIT